MGKLQLGDYSRHQAIRMKEGWKAETAVESSGVFASSVPSIKKTLGCYKTAADTSQLVPMLSASFAKLRLNDFGSRRTA